MDAALGALAPSTLRCAEHVSQSYMAFTGAVQMLSPGSYPLMLVSNVVLYLAACRAFILITRLAFPDPSHDVGRALLGAAFALHPAILASVVQPTIDFPLLAAFLWGLVFTLRDQRAALVAVGLAMVFAKETGVVLYAGLIGTRALLMLHASRQPTREFRRVLAEVTTLAIPLFAFAMYLGYRATIPEATVVWAAGTTHKSILKRFVLPRFDRPFASFLVMIFVLNFAWISTAVIGADAVVGARRVLARMRGRVLDGADIFAVRFLTVAAVIVTYALTRFTTYANTRYVLVALALWLLVMYASLVRLRLAPTPRYLLAGSVAAGYAVSTLLTIDPVSRGLYGTFAFGNRSLLRLTRITHECCGAGRDQLVYNLQFTKLADLTSDATAAVAADDSMTIFVPHDMLWGALGPLDSATHRRTLRRDAVLSPRLLEPDSLTTLSAPARAILLGLPNGDVAQAIQDLSAHYTVGPPRRITRGAYWLNVYPLTLRGVPLLDAVADSRARAH